MRIAPISSSQPASARTRVSGCSRSRRANDFSIPGSPSQWSAWKWVMNTLSKSSEPDRAHELALGAFAAVEQQPVAAAAHEHRGQAAPGARHRAAGAREEQGQVHVATVAVAGGRDGGGKLSPAQAPSSTASSAPVAQWIERSPPEREVASSNLAGRARSFRPSPHQDRPPSGPMRIAGVCSDDPDTPPYDHRRGALACRARP